MAEGALDIERCFDHLVGVHDHRHVLEQDSLVGGSASDGCSIASIDVRERAM